MAVAGLPAVLAQRPLRVLRPQDAAAVYAHPRPEVARLTRAGLLHQLAPGFYAVVPQDRVGDYSWRPTLEAAAVGVAAARHGPDRVVLMHLSAARLHGAVPRALGVAIVAVPEQRPPLRLADRNATVMFVQRRTDRLDAERLGTDLGPALVTSVEQTVLDLARRPLLGGIPEQVWETVRVLLPRADPDRLAELARQQRLGGALRRALAAARPEPAGAGPAPSALALPARRNAPTPA